MIVIGACHVAGGKHEWYAGSVVRVERASRGPRGSAVVHVLHDDETTEAYELPRDARDLRREQCGESNGSKPASASTAVKQKRGAAAAAKLTAADARLVQYSADNLARRLSLNADSSVRLSDPTLDGTSADDLAAFIRRGCLAHAPAAATADRPSVRCWLAFLLNIDAAISTASGLAGPDGQAPELPRLLHCAGTIREAFDFVLAYVETVQPPVAAADFPLEEALGVMHAASLLHNLLVSELGCRRGVRPICREFFGCSFTASAAVLMNCLFSAFAKEEIKTKALFQRSIIEIFGLLLGPELNLPRPTQESIRAAVCSHDNVLRLAELLMHQVESKRDQQAFSARMFASLLHSPTSALAFSQADELETVRTRLIRLAIERVTHAAVNGDVVDEHSSSLVHILVACFTDQVCNAQHAACGDTMLNL